MKEIRPGKIRRSKMRNGKMLAFQTECIGKAPRPRMVIRRAMAWNIDRIEKRASSHVVRVGLNGPVKHVGSGSYGTVFHLENGRVLKVTEDDTEAAAAVFWKLAQKKDGKLLNGTVEVFDVFSIKNKQKKKFYCIVREEVNVPIFFPVFLKQLLEKFVLNFLEYCSSLEFGEFMEDGRVHLHPRSLISLNRARIAVQAIKKDTIGLGAALEYAWNKGLPMSDATIMNVGIRTKKTHNKKARVGAWVIFDFGGLDPECFNHVPIDAQGRELKQRNRVAFYYKKVPAI